MCAVCVRYRKPNHWTNLIEICMGILLNGGKVRSWDLTTYPNPRGQGALNMVWDASAASGVQFGENFIIHKLKGTPVLVGRVTFSDP